MLATIAAVGGLCDKGKEENLSLGPNQVFNGKSVDHLIVLTPECGHKLSIV